MITFLLYILLPPVMTVVVFSRDTKLTLNLLKKKISNIDLSFIPGSFKITIYFLCFNYIYFLIYWYIDIKYSV